MKPLSTYTVVPYIPNALDGLMDLAYNLRWTWDHETKDLFRRLNTELWEASGHNPIQMLGMLNRNQMDEIARDDGILTHFNRVHQGLLDYLGLGHTHPDIAYFSFEYGLAECLPIYSGGLGILSGDHLKAASDLNIPLVAVGVMYTEGYFQQSLNADGWQQESYPKIDIHRLPITLERDDANNEYIVEIPYPDNVVYARLWRAQVGRIQLVLLDTNIESNSEADRRISDRLYGGDLDHRIRQEILLGVGGFLALKRLGYSPKVYHMNEGHSAFLVFAQIQEFVTENGLSFKEAFEAARSRNVFTTHTPIPAGNDTFSDDVIAGYFRKYCESVGVSVETFLDLGHILPASQRNDASREDYCMTVLALRASVYRNGVSRLHGGVTRRMWRSMWPSLPNDEVPISSITNGAHLPSWISSEMCELLSRYIGRKWLTMPHDPQLWEKVDNIPTRDIWRVHMIQKERLVQFTRERLQKQLAARNVSQTEVKNAAEVLDPTALTIGFARRFVEYKRTSLIFHDLERLERIVTNSNYPVQIIYAGKAHPKDTPGKEAIKVLTHLASDKRFENRIIFLENYDINVAQHLVQGVDIWLNNPIRPLEASGTSGMKASFNGVLNFSILDGWWAEAYGAHAHDVGWAIGKGEEYDNREYQDFVEANDIYNLLEQEIIPLFYEHNGEGYPVKWASLMKSMIKRLAPAYNTTRMVDAYNRRFYSPVIERVGMLSSDGYRPVKALCKWKGLLQERWHQIRIDAISDDREANQIVEDQFGVGADVILGEVNPEEVTVELYNGRINNQGEITPEQIIPMELREKRGDGRYHFFAMVNCESGGQYGYTVRVLPKHAHLVTPYDLHCVHWANEDLNLC